MPDKIPETHKASPVIITLVITVAVFILLVFFGPVLIRALAICHDVTSGLITFASLMILLPALLLSWLYAPVSYTAYDFYFIIKQRNLIIISCIFI